MIVCGICRGVDKKQFSKCQYRPKNPRKYCTKLKPALIRVERADGSQRPLLRFYHQAVELAGRVANQRLEVTHKLVHEPLALHLGYHVTVVIIPDEKSTLLILKRADFFLQKNTW